MKKTLAISLFAFAAIWAGMSAGVSAKEEVSMSKIASVMSTNPPPSVVQAACPNPLASIESPSTLNITDATQALNFLNNLGLNSVQVNLCLNFNKNLSHEATSGLEQIVKSKLSSNIMTNPQVTVSNICMNLIIDIKDRSFIDRVNEILQAPVINPFTGKEMGIASEMVGICDSSSARSCTIHNLPPLVVNHAQAHGHNKK